MARLRSNARDQRAWGEFYRKLRPPVYYTAYKLSGGNVAIAEDITQDTFLRFLDYGALSRIPDEAHATAYLRQTARRLLCDRRYGREITTSNPEEALEHESYDDEDRYHLLWDLEQLSPELTEADRQLLAWLIEEWTIEEIAAALKISYSAAGVRLHRLKRRLRQKFKGL
ncbi:MAG: sigma-70 family RNA polymerase sigma factor [Nitrososphaera sp.]|nr:sigma-70 family RNA polymerase sigma factor [Nitrososphaera sp.]